MATDYISREECIKDLREYEETALDGLTVVGCISRIKRIPAADVRPVVHGEWIVDSIATNIFYCSVCGNDAPVEPCGGTEYKSPFCPNCGADMREEGSNG